LFNLKHLELSFGLSSGKFVLSLQSSKVGLGSSFLGGSSFSLLNSLSSKELLLHLFGLEFLCGFLFLKFFKFGGSSLGEEFFVLSFLLGI